MAFFYFVWEKHFIPEINTIPFVMGISEEGEFIWCEDEILDDYAVIIEECYRLSRDHCKEIAYTEE